jgi:hypothetical protein
MRSKSKVVLGCTLLTFGLAVVALSVHASLSRQSVGDVDLEITRVWSENGNYSIDMVATARGKDVKARMRASQCTVITPGGQTVRASYVRMGDSNGKGASATLLAGLPVELTVRWALDNPRYTKLLRVGLAFNFDGLKELKFNELEVRESR